MSLYYAQQFAVTKLNVAGGIDASQTTAIVVQSVTGIDITVPGVICLSWSDPIDTDTYEYISYTSINVSNELQGVTRGAEGSTGRAHANQVDIAWVLTESHINKLNDMFTTGGEGFKQIATPANPASGFNKLYFKSGDNLHTLNSAGVESGVATGFKVTFTPATALFTTANYPQTVVNVGTNLNDMTLDFDTTTAETCAFPSFTIPAGLTFTTATAYIKFRMASATSGTVVFTITTTSGAEGEAWDTAGTADDTAAETVPDTAGKWGSVSKALTTTTWAAGESLSFKLTRKVSADDAAGDAKVAELQIVFS